MGQQVCALQAPRLPLWLNTLSTCMPCSGAHCAALFHTLASSKHTVAPLESLATEQYGDTKLPDSVMVNIMECLAASRQPGGLRGFAEVARDLANASLVG